MFYLLYREFWKKSAAVPELRAEHVEAPTHIDSFDYNMDHPKRGLCLIFNHTVSK